MSKLMQRRTGLGNVDAVLAEDSRADAVDADAVDAELLTEVCRIIAVDDKYPAVFVERIEDRLRHFPDFQQEFVRIALHPVLHRDRRIGRRDSQVLCQDGMKKLRSFGAAHVSAYLAAMENETTAARMILTGRLAGLQPAVIRERLRETYA